MVHTDNEQQSASKASTDWSKEELLASVETYLHMQQLEWAGKPCVKKHQYDALAQRFGRTAKSYEYRMQNISYVLSLMGRDWLTGLKPAKNVGANVAAVIEELIGQVEHKPVQPVVAFEIAVREEVKKKQLPMPSGITAPQAKTAAATQYQRDPKVKAWVLRQADGVCECCQQPAPFLGADGLPYLEVHHIRKLAEQGSDTVSNAVAICPNCHRQLHYGADAKGLVEKLYRVVVRLVRE